jgi:hypothetical protein
MDIYCRRCGEPWDMDYINFEMTSQERNHFKSGAGCPCCYGKKVEKRPFRADVSGMLQDMLGDDLDGVAAELEDAEDLFGSDFN